MHHILDIAGSYIIGGMVLLSLIGLTFHFSAKSQETKLSEIAQRSATEIGAIIEHDFQKLGYRVSANDKILNISGTSITFLADLDNDGVVDTVYYSVAKGSGIVELKRRTSSPVTEWTTPVQNFIVAGYDDEGTVTQLASEVKSISVELIFKEDSFKDSKGEVSGSWKRKFFPRNL